MVPKTIKVGNSTEIGETMVNRNHQVLGTGRAWREEAKKLRYRNGQITRDFDETCYFDDSVPILSGGPPYGTSQEIDYGFTPRGNSHATLNKELIDVTKSAPVVTLPSKNVEVGTNVDLNLRGEGKQVPAVISTRKEDTETISKVDKRTEPSGVRENLRKIYDKVLVVDNVASMKNVVAKLVNQYRNLVHACDTEVSRIEVKEETPVDHGELICFSIYCGSEAEFGNGKSCIWVDVLGENGMEVLAEFKPYFEDSSIRKVWHNYSFDSHIIRNHGIEISGFHADTMHMARLWDSARRTEGGYSLEALTSDPKVLGTTHTKEEAEFLGKISMKTIFGKRKLKKMDQKGNLSSFLLLKSFKLKEWYFNGKLISGRTMLDFYHELWRPFGMLLVKMEA